MKEFNINGIDIPLSTSWNSIAVSLSGGADSALLAYLLASIVVDNNLKIKINFISHVRCWKTKPWQKYDSLNVYEYLKNKFSNLIDNRYEGFVSPDLEWGDQGPILIDEYGKNVSGDNAQIRSFAEYICYHNKIDAYYNAVTRNPIDVDFKGMYTRDINLTKNNQHLRLMKHMNGWAIHPFRFVTKDWVVRQYKQLNIEDLFKLTRSCEGVFQNIDYTNYVPGHLVPVCGKCFWCKEREWAIEQNK